MNTPDTYIPLHPADFVGPSARLAAILQRKTIEARRNPRAVKVLVVGPPGNGKTAIVNMAASLMAGHATQIESVNGRNVDVELVRRWMREAQYCGMAGGMVVKVVNELDTATPAAQDLLLTYLDELPAHVAFLATSNLNLSALAERFQTRLQQFRLAVPSANEIAALLERWVDPATALAIATRAKGNVRAALLDTQSILDCQQLTVLEKVA